MSNSDCLNMSHNQNLCSKFGLPRAMSRIETPDSRTHLQPTSAPRRGEFSMGAWPSASSTGRLGAGDLELGVRNSMHDSAIQTHQFSGQRGRTKNNQGSVTPLKPCHPRHSACKSIHCKKHGYLNLLWIVDVALELAATALRNKKSCDIHLQLRSSRRVL